MDLNKNEETYSCNLILALEDNNDEERVKMYSIICACV